ncbi:non-structural protein 3 [Cherax quadricarinatus densovirus]|uniref:Non-structural protein 3 n=1 Tax=Cherax quadricarinatus densovirus TaxID=1642018 RepID=A0A0E3XTM9_9VIRU|nr:non-structural protein 3 [Cherax quadricarinatus densovirus]AKC42759.1 non-structural protein 3 [Cherax quadricarinatus densovirus]
MACVYGIENCDHTKCFRCGECTRGSQVHRLCYSNITEEDYAISQLLASSTECLPTESDEETADQIRSDTPISMQVQEYLDWENTALFSTTYRFHTYWTHFYGDREEIDSDYSTPEASDEDSQSLLRNKIKVHRYLTSEMTAREFFLANRDFDIDVLCLPDDSLIRMRLGTVTKFDPIAKQHFVYHKECIDPEQFHLTEKGFSKAVLSVKATNKNAFISLIEDLLFTFFCQECKKFIFHTVEYMEDSVWKLPNENIWPDCKHLLYNCHLLYDLNTYVNLKGHKLIATVSPQEPPTKRQRLEFHE